MFWRSSDWKYLIFLFTFFFFINDELDLLDSFI